MEQCGVINLLVGESWYVHNEQKAQLQPLVAYLSMQVRSRHMSVNTAHHGRKEDQEKRAPNLNALHHLHDDVVVVNFHARQLCTCWTDFRGNGTPCKSMTQFDTVA